MLLSYQKNKMNATKKSSKIYVFSYSDGLFNEKGYHMEYNADNVFAKIIRGELPIQKIYEDEYALAFYDIHPKAKVHALVISKALSTDFSDFIDHSSDDEISGYMRAITKTITLLGLDESGYRLVFNTGSDSGQEVPHLHVHILGGEKLQTENL